MIVKELLIAYVKILSIKLKFQNEWNSSYWQNFTVICLILIVPFFCLLLKLCLTFHETLIRFKRKSQIRIKKTIIYKI